MDSTGLFRISVQHFFCFSTNFARLPRNQEEGKFAQNGRKIVKVKAFGTLRFNVGAFTTFISEDSSSIKRPTSQDSEFISEDSYCFILKSSA